MCVAVAVSAAVSARTAAVPPLRRDLVVIAVSAVVGLVALPISAAVVVVAATAIAVTATAGLSGARTTTAPTTTPTQTPATPPAVVAVQAGTQLLTPLLDDASLRRPARPRVVTRTSVRRLLESVVDTAWHAQPAARGHPPVDVTAEGDPDIDGDVGELGEALCAVVDNALGEYVRHPERRIHITVRSTGTNVSIDVVDGSAPELAGAWRPFLVGGPHDVDRPGFGVSLMRAQLLIERHGGQLSLGRGAGAAVHVSLPRRRQRGPVGLA
jgi:K+-sensing histidine kinase KdpD